VTLLRLLRSHVPEKMFSANSKKTKTAERKTELSFSRTDYASVHDSLLTLYHGVRLYHRATDSCQWAGADQILPTLRKVPAVLARKLDVGPTSLPRPYALDSASVAAPHV